MNSCTLGLHAWAYNDEGKKRWCTKCQKKQEKDASGKWIEGRPAKQAPVDNAQYCQCPRDYTISLKTMKCQRCGLPRRPR